MRCHHPEDSRNCYSERSILENFVRLCSDELELNVNVKNFFSSLINTVISQIVPPLITGPLSTPLLPLSGSGPVRIRVILAGTEKKREEERQEGRLVASPTKTTTTTELN